MLKAGFISYLNAYPFYYPFHKKLIDTKGWELIVKRPGELNAMMKNSELDVSLISAIEYAFYPKQYQIVANIGLSSNGYVDSVKLVSKYPMEELAGKNIEMTSASATSAMAMKILFQEKGISTNIVKYPVENGLPLHADAFLVIGDEALTENCSDFQFSYDIGEIWQEEFGRNIVFAIAVVNESSILEKISELTEFCRELQRAPFVSENDENFVKACREYYPNISQPMSYLANLQFSFNEKSMSDLKFFFEQAHKHGLISTNPELVFFEPAFELA